MLQPHHLNSQQDSNSKTLVVVILVVLFGPLFLLILSYKFQLYLYRIKLTGTNEKKFLERIIIKIKKSFYSIIKKNVKCIFDTNFFVYKPLSF